MKGGKEFLNHNNVSLNIKSSDTLYLVGKLGSILFLVCLLAINANSKTTTVTTIAKLQTAINTAASGDTILLANGTYLNNTITISKNYLTIMPVKNGGVFLNGTNAININGNYINFRGFQFTSGTITSSAIMVNGSNNNLSQLNFNGYDAAHMLMIFGQYNIISFCNFQNKPATNMVSHGGNGDMVQIIPDSLNVGYNVIRYCSFQHMPGFGGDYGNECIRIGDGVYSKFISRTIVEFCYFEDTGNGDSESISVKSQQNCIRYNTTRNNPDAMFSFRNGDYNVAYGNFFFQSGGFRCKEANNIYCYNNYFENANTNPPVFEEFFDSVSGNNFNFIHNTFYRGIPIVIDSGMKNCTWANNIFYSDSGSIFSGIKKNQTFLGNIYQGKLGMTITTGVTKANPLLAINSAGFYSITAGSPAINAAVAGYSKILAIPNINDDSTISLDIQGLHRPSTITLKDVGCDEDTTGTITNHPLQLCEVGPSYLCSTFPVKFISVNANRTIQHNIIVNWTVAAETSLKYYRVKHSIDGINFISIGEINVPGNNTTTNKYNFTDIQPTAGSNFYLIESIGENGDIEQSKTVIVEPEGATKTCTVYPNPITSHAFTVLLNNQQIDNGTLRVLNMFGQEVYINRNISIQNDCRVNLPEGLKSGIYLLEISQINKDKIITKIIVQ